MPALLPRVTVLPLPTAPYKCAPCRRFVGDPCLPVCHALEPAWGACTEPHGPSDHQTVHPADVRPYSLSGTSAAHACGHLCECRCFGRMEAAELSNCLDILFLLLSPFLEPSPFFSCPTDLLGKSCPPCFSPFGCLCSKGRPGCASLSVFCHVGLIHLRSLLHEGFLLSPFHRTQAVVLFSPFWNLK